LGHRKVTAAPLGGRCVAAVRRLPMRTPCQVQIREKCRDSAVAIVQD